MAVIIGTSFIYGVVDPLPLSGFPDGKIKIKMRNESFVEAFVKTESGIRNFLVMECDGKWMPSYELGRNFRD